MAGKKLQLDLSMSTHGVDKATKQFAKLMQEIRETHKWITGFNSQQKKLFDRYYEALARGNNIPFVGRGAQVARFAAKYESFTPRGMEIEKARYQQLSKTIQTVMNNHHSTGAAFTQYYGNPSERNLSTILRGQRNVINDAIARVWVDKHNLSPIRALSNVTSSRGSLPSLRTAVSAPMLKLSLALGMLTSVVKSKATEVARSTSALARAGAGKAVSGVAAVHGGAVSLMNAIPTNLLRAGMALGVLSAAIKTKIQRVPALVAQAVPQVKAKLNPVAQVFSTLLNKWPHQYMPQLIRKAWDKLTSADVMNKAQLHSRKGLAYIRAFALGNETKAASKAIRNGSSDVQVSLKQVGRAVSSGARFLKAAAHIAASLVRTAWKLVVAPIRIGARAFNSAMKAFAVGTVAAYFGKNVVNSMVQRLTGANMKELVDATINVGQRSIASEAMIGKEPTINAFGALREYSSRTGAQMEPLVDTFQEALKYSRDTPAILEFEQIMDRFARFTHRELSTVAKSMMQLVSTGDVGRLSVTLGVPQTALMNSRIEDAVTSQDFRKINEALEEIANKAGITQEAFDRYVNSAINQIDRLKIVTKNLAVDFLGYFTQAMGEVIRPLNDLLSSNGAQQFMSSLSLIISALPQSVMKSMNMQEIATSGVNKAIDKISSLLMQANNILNPLMAGMSYAFKLLTGSISDVASSFDFSDQSIEAMRISQERAAERVMGVVDYIADLVRFALKLPTLIQDAMKYIVTNVDRFMLLVAGSVRIIREVATVVMSYINKIAGHSLYEEAVGDKTNLKKVYSVESIKGASEVEGFSVLGVASMEGVDHYNKYKNLLAGADSGLSREADLRHALYEKMGTTVDKATSEQATAVGALMTLYKNYASSVDPMKFGSEVDGKKYAVFSESIDSALVNLIQLSRTDEEVMSKLKAVDLGSLSSSLKELPSFNLGTSQAQIDKSGILNEVRESFMNFAGSMKEAKIENELKSYMSQLVTEAVKQASGGKYTSMDELNVTSKEMKALAIQSRDIFQNVLKPQFIEYMITRGINKSNANNVFDKLSQLLTSREKFFGFRDITEQRPVPVKPVGAVNIAKEDLVMLAELAQREYVSNFNAQIYAPAPVNTYNVQSNANSLEAMAEELRRRNAMTPQSPINNYGAMSRNPGVVVVGG